MGASRDDLTKYPRTPHLFGSRGTDNDKHLGHKDSLDFIADASLIVEEKLDGTNVGIHFTAAGRMVLQCRGHGLIGPSQFDSQFENPLTGRTDNLMEGLYLRTEAEGHVTGRAKFVRPEFVEKAKQSEHWQHQAVVPNLLGEGTEIWP